MQYESYERKIAKIADFFKWIFKHRVVILLSTLFVLASTTALLATRGMILSSGKCPESIVYGEKLNYSAKAFLSKTYYEYSPADDEEWSEEFPTAPGEYLVRAVAKATFGVKYGDPESFTLLPRSINVSIANKNVTYGELPEVSAELVKGDSIACTDFVYGEGRVTAEAIPEAITITNAQGKDVTSCYLITTSAREIVTVPRNITVAAKDAGKVYDGTPLVANGYDVVKGSVVAGDSMHATVSGSITDVGSATAKVSCSFVNEDGESVNKWYKVTYVTGSLTVSKRKITVTSSDYSAMYDGSNHSSKIANLTDGSLVDGQSLSYNSWMSSRDVCDASNTFYCTVVTSSGADVTKNYEIDSVFGKFTVAQRPITVSTDSAGGVYNGLSYSSGKYDISGSGIASGDSYDIRFTNSPIDAGEHKNECVIDIYYFGINVNDNYAITYDFGDISITKRPIHVKTPTDSTVYFGGDFSKYELEFVSGSLVDGDSFSVTDYTKAVNVGVYDNEVSFGIYNYSRGVSVTDNYTIELTRGKLTVNKRDLTVISGSEEFTYNAEYQYCDTVSFGGPYGIVAGHVANIVTKSGVKDVTDRSKNEITVVIMSGNVDVTENYNITYQYGDLSVLPRDIYVYMDSDETYYNGKAFSCATFEVVDIISKHSFRVTSSSSATDAGEYTNTIYGYDILDENNKSVKHNYTVHVVNGTLLIKKRPVKFTTASADKVYDDTPLTKAEWLLAGDSMYDLVSGHKLYASAPIGSITDVGSVNNLYVGDVKIHDAYDNDISYNYDITAVCGTLTVNPRPIIVYTESDTWVYDGDYHVFNKVLVSAKSEYDLCTNHSISSEYKSYKNVITDAENSIGFVILAGGVRDVTKNYDITAEWGRITVEPRPITVTNNVTFDSDRTITLIYDGDVHSYSDVLITKGSLCENSLKGIKEYISVTRYAEFKSIVENASIAIEFVILDAQDNDVTSNYDITEEWGTLTIKPRPITVTNGGVVFDDADKNLTFIYDGAEHVYGNVLVSSGSICYNPAKGVDESILVIKSANFKNIVDKASMRIEFKIVDINGEDVTFNYDITEEWGTLTIKPRPITVTNGGVVFDDADKNLTFIYDGAEHVYGNVLVSSGSICYNPSKGVEESILVTKAAKFKNIVDKASMRIEFKIVDINGEDVTFNYDITEEWGALTIKPRPITVTNGDVIYDDEETKTLTIIYDGQEREYKVVLVSKGSVCNDPENGVAEYIKVTKTAKFKNVIKDASMKIEFVILDADDKDVTFNYEITEEWGTITIKPRPITIQTESYDAVYDGKDHNLNKVEIVKGSLCTGHKSAVGDAIYRDVVTNVDNEVTFTIFDEKEIDVTENYEITVILGKVTIHKKVVLVNTESKTWNYDGKEHYHKKYSIVSGYDVIEWHSLEIKSYPTIKEVGSKPNDITFIVADEKMLVDVTHNYDIRISNCGILTVLPEDVDIGLPDVVEPPENTDLGLPPSGDGEGESKVVFILTSTTSGKVYLKQMSYGDYTGKGWNAAQEYEDLLLNSMSAYYLAAKAAANGSGTSPYILAVNPVGGVYALPYYAIEKGLDSQMSDVRISGDASGVYYVYYYTSLSGAELPEGAIDFENAYSTFVYSQYLSMDTATYTYMQQIIAREGFSRYDADIIDKVATYIQNAARYDLRYNRKLDESENIVVAFLETYKSGICQHYASAATMLYRALGIPARYTVGYVGDTVAGTEVQVTTDQAHAWVEVYIDGIGWMQVEVTGSSVDFEPIVVQPEKQSKAYDGKPLYAKNEIIENDIIKLLLNYGYTYEVTVEGEQTAIGKGVSTVTSFKIFDPQKNEVTGMFDISYLEGELEVSAGQIEIYIYEKTFEYDGKTYGYSNLEYVIRSANEGVTLDIKNIKITMQNVGVLTSNDINRDIGKYIDFAVYDSETMEELEGYTLKVVNYVDGGVYNVISITPRSITVVTGSATKPYNGEALTNHTFYISIGMLGDGHVMTLRVTGTITAQGSTENLIDKESLRIVDADGNDVTKNYDVTYILGILTVE